MIVDDDQLLADSIGRHLSRRGHRTTSVYLLSEAVAALDASLRAEMPFQAIITDLQLPDGDGRDLIRAARQKLPQCPIVLMTGSGSVSGAVEAIRLGALTVLEKPTSLETIEAELRGAIERRGALDAGLDAAMEAGIVGHSEAIRAVVRSVLLAAPTEATILIEGETGTGKELLARAVHRLSRRAHKPFVALNCAALSETLAESELFGHVKGAFTGADRPRAGCFRQADEGTLFLDEIGEMSLPLQAKLLRVLQEGEVQPVGSDRSERVDVRVVAATNRILADQAASGRFREDLYYRLNVLSLRLPPLRERTTDIAPLVDRFTGGARRFTPSAMAALERHPWPGNVRELQNLVQRLVVLKPDGDIDIADLPSALRGQAALPGSETRLPEQPIDLNAVLREMEDRLIREALDRCGGNKSEAARSLGLNRTTLVEKLRRMQSPRRPPQ